MATFSSLLNGGDGYLAPDCALAPKKERMMRARDIMTGSLTICSPLDSVAQAAQRMRQHNIGDVLVVDEGKLVGIVTDRDIALRVTAKSRDPDRVTVHDVMSRRVLMGEPGWDLDQVAKTMGRHQIRRLPIAENGVPVGIVSLSDVALHNSHKSHVAKSLKHISESQGTHRLHPVKRGLLSITLGLGLVAGTAVALTFFPNSIAKLRKRIRSSHVDNRLWDTVQAGRKKLSQITGRRSATYPGEFL
jgi:CBS domain-containing protein